MTDTIRQIVTIRHANDKKDEAEQIKTELEELGVKAVLVSEEIFVEYV